MKNLFIIIIVAIILSIGIQGLFFVGEKIHNQIKVINIDVNNPPKNTIFFAQRYPKSYLMKHSRERIGYMLKWQEKMNQTQKDCFNYKKGFPKEFSMENNGFEPSGNRYDDCIVYSHHKKLLPLFLNGRVYLNLPLSDGTWYLDGGYRSVKNLNILEMFDGGFKVGILSKRVEIY